ncbi:transposase [Bradyrhizobium sp. 150]|nr:transposase [Bradyrhizobium sp. 150]
MICALICKQMSKRDDGYGSIRSERRRRWTSAEKLRIVEESVALGTNVVEVSRRHDVHRNLVTAWRQARTGPGLRAWADAAAG